MKPKKQLVFKDFFDQQYGKRPGGITSDKEYIHRVKMGEAARTILRERVLYDKCYQYALYAWIGAADHQLKTRSRNRRKASRR